ncbi:MAG: DNA polymerase III subunit delta [Gemmatimonadota bacterium]|nr:DNA polymerase III subunit delta [Gemmatimonadota bacterium]MDH4352106.1 DNA polymerase III subunit delta [Gemmatimonadota bacterium]MDH5195641.1 DNA polymerase III subunit delta [Gemmatimonadota bacterium]
MPSVTLERAYGGLRTGEIAAAYCLSGPADVLKDELADAITGAVLEPSTRDFNLDVRAAGDLDGEALHALVETPPMLAERRVVVVRGIDQWRKNAKVWEVVSRYLDRPSPSTVLILVHAGDAIPDARATRGAVHVEVGPLKPAQTARWIQRQAKNLGLTLEGDAAEHLLACVGGDLGVLQQELAKLGAALPAGANVTAADVGALVGVNRGETVHDWVQAVLQRQPIRAIELLDVVLRQGSVTGVQLVMALGTALIGARLARALVDAGTPWSRLRGAVFERIKAARPPGLRRWGDEAQSWTDAARAWPAPDLDHAIAAAAEADRRLKSTTISDEQGILVTMLLTLAEPRAAT